MSTARKEIEMMMHEAIEELTKNLNELSESIDAYLPDDEDLLKIDFYDDLVILGESLHLSDNSMYQDEIIKLLESIGVNLKGIN